jgi:hypothetical protein
MAVRALTENSSPTWGAAGAERGHVQGKDDVEEIGGDVNGAGDGDAGEERRREDGAGGGGHGETHG